MPKSNYAPECRVSFRTLDGEAFADVCLDDESLIENLVLQPLRSAQRDATPAAYAVVGTLTIISADESRETLVLFSPWGHYSRGNEYFVADFSGLQSACTEALRDAQRLLDAVKKDGEDFGFPEEKRRRSTSLQRGSKEQPDDKCGP